MGVRAAAVLATGLEVRIRVRVRGRVRSPNPNPNPNPIPNPNPRYIIGTIVLVLIIAVKLERDYADRYIYVWAIYASVVSSWTVIACRGLFSMIAQVPSDCAGQQCHHDELHWPCQSTIGHWLFWLSAVT